MDQKERIIEQAMQMFVTQGIKSVRMDDIAQQLGVSKRTLYELFGDKEGLLYLAMEAVFSRASVSNGPKPVSVRATCSKRCLWCWDAWRTSRR